MEQFNRTLVFLISLTAVLLLVVAAVFPAPPEPKTTANIDLPPLAVLNTPQTVRFIAFGDSGMGNPIQRRLGRHMARSHEARPFQFALMLGDLIYPDGNVKRYGYSRFTQPYEELLHADVEFKPALGNHDVEDGYGDDVMAFFNMPGRYYTFTRENVQFFALDTNRFNGEQQRWLKQQLAESKARWKIVYGHYPVFSSGLHGNTGSLERELKPLLEIYGVDLYLAGHDHMYERFEPINGVAYVVSGGGGANLHGFRKIKSHSLIRQKAHHFLDFTISGDKLWMRAVNSNGETIDNWSKNKRLVSPSAPAA